MTKTLRDLFFGNLVTHERPIDKKGRYYMAACAAKIKAESLEKTLTTEQKPLWEEYMSRAAEESAELECESYIAGFRLATHLWMEAAVPGDNNENWPLLG